MKIPISTMPKTFNSRTIVAQAEATFKRVSTLRGAGTIPQADVPALEAMGVAAVFGPGTPLDRIVSFLREQVRPRTAELGT